MIAANWISIFSFRFSPLCSGVLETPVRFTWFQTSSSGFSSSAYLNRFRIVLVGSFERFLWGESEFGKQFAKRSQAEFYCKLLRDQTGDHGPRPETDIQTVRARILAVDPSKHLFLLARSQSARMPYRLSLCSCGDRGTRARIIAGAGPTSLANRGRLGLCKSSHEQAVLPDRDSEAAHSPGRVLLLACPKCGADVGVWCKQDGRTPNGKRLLIHEERKAAAGKYGRIGWHTFRHTCRSWLGEIGAPMKVQ